MSNAIIRSALEGRLKTWADAQSPPIPIAFQNAPFTPPNQARYMRAFLLPAETDSNDLAGEHRAYMGLLQVSICVPDGTGSGAAETLSTAIEALFPVSLRLVKSGLTVMITKPASAGPALPEAGIYVVPMSIRYRADKT